jgi:hypothetical protein
MGHILEHHDVADLIGYDHVIVELNALDSLSNKAESQLFIEECFFHKVTLRNTKGRKEKANIKILLFCPN